MGLLWFYEDNYFHMRLYCFITLFSYFTRSSSNIGCDILTWSIFRIFYLKTLKSSSISHCAFCVIPIMQVVIKIIHRVVMWSYTGSLNYLLSIHKFLYLFFGTVYMLFRHFKIVFFIRCHFYVVSCNFMYLFRVIYLYIIFLFMFRGCGDGFWS